MDPLAIKLSLMVRFSKTKALLGALFTLVVVGAVVVCMLGGEPRLRGSVQLYLVPALLILCSSVSFAGVKLPRIIVGIAAIGILGGAVVRYADFGLRPGAIEIAPFSDDALQSNTRIFRDKVRKLWGKQSSALFGVGSVTISSESAAQRLLRERPNVGGIVWGGERRLHVSVRPSAPISLRGLPEDSVAVRYLDEWHVSDLSVITELPRFGLSEVMNLPTFEFTARVLRAVMQLPAALGADEGAESFEHDLRIAATIKAAWTSIEHLAVPKLILGNHYLLRAISGPELQWGDLKCAESSFASARAFLQNRRDSAFMSILLNNEAILRAFKAEYSVEVPKLREQVQNNLATAVGYRERVTDGDPQDSMWMVVESNKTALGAAVWDNSQDGSPG